MGDRSVAVVGERMAGGRRFPASSICSDGFVLGSTPRSKGGSVGSGGDQDQYYMDRMREILIGFPNTGPPTYPVQILDHLYMGNQRNADNVELLRRYGITHVLNCAGLRRFDISRSPYSKESGIKGFLMLPAEDTEDFDMAQHFDEAMTFLDRVKKLKGKALVHCNLGVNRSGAIIAAYLMAEQKRTLLEVINYLKVKRFVVLSNKGFRRQLIQFARTRGLLDPIIRCDSETVQNHGFNRRTFQNAQDDKGGGRGGGSGNVRGGSGSQRDKNERAEESHRLGGSRRIGEGRVENVAESIGEFEVDGNAGNGRAAIQEETMPGQIQKGKRQGIANAVSSRLTDDRPSSVEPIQGHNNTQLQDGPSSIGGSAKTKGLSSSSAAAASEDVGPRHRLWTLPRYMGRRGVNGRSPPPPPPAVEVIVSEHKEETTLTNPKTDEGRPSLVSPERTDAKSRAKTPLRQLEPVYETKSCNDAGSGGPSIASSSSSNSTASSGRLTAAESMSAKISGFLNLLQPKKPFRSTSYSNVSSSQSPSSSFSSLSPAASATDERSSISSGSVQTSAPSSSLSTARPLRIYTRSSTDSEIYRTRQDTSSTAGQFGLPRPASKP